MTGPIAAARDVSVAFGALTAVACVSLEIRPGETLALVGESGSGKTTLGKALLGLCRPAAGRVELMGRDLGILRRRDRLWLSRQAQLFAQDPVSSLSPRLSIRRLLGEPLAIHGLPRRPGWARIEALMALMGLPPAILDRYPHQISGGQARRVGIARALVLDPRFVVADEPTAGLDLSVQGDILNLLVDLQRRQGLTYLLVSHNLDVVRRVAGRTAVMYLGQIVESGPTPALFGRPAHPYTHALLSARPRIDPAKRTDRVVLTGDIPSPLAPPPGCRFHTRCPRAQPRCAVEAPTPTALDEARWVGCHYPLVSA